MKMKKWSLRVSSLSWTWKRNKQVKSSCLWAQFQNWELHKRRLLNHVTWSGKISESWNSKIACFRAKIMGYVNVLMCNWQIVANLYCLVKCTYLKKKICDVFVFTINSEKKLVFGVFCVYETCDFFCITAIANLSHLMDNQWSDHCSRGFLNQ